MKAKEFIIELNKELKPRNFVAKNASLAGKAGQHKDKKKAEKQGDVKHKKQSMPTESADTDPSKYPAHLRDEEKRAAWQKWIRDSTKKSIAAQRDIQNLANQMRKKQTGVAEGLSPQQKQAHQANLDAAQREMDRREAEGEDMTGATIDKKTYKIIKPKQPNLAEGLTEARNSLFAFVKQQFPTWPDYVLKDFLYAQAKGIRDQAELDDFLKRNKQDFGNCKWTLTKLPITFDIFTPKTRRMLASREGGSSNPFQVPRDAERHAQQSQMIQQKGVSAEPIIVAKLANGYDLIEGWHRTIQHLKAFPQGYTGPAWVCTGATYKSESVEQGAAEGKKHVSPSGVETNMAPSDDDYDINYGKNGLVSKFRKAQGVAEGRAGVDDTDTVGFSVNSEAAYMAVMKRFGDYIDQDETSGVMYAPARVWPRIEMVAFDADGEGAVRDDGVAENDRSEMDTPEFQRALSSVKKKAAQGPMTTVYDPKTRKYKVVPVNTQGK
jgi:hypothetical protein